MKKGLFTIFAMAHLIWVASSPPLRVVATVPWIDALIAEIGEGRVEHTSLVRSFEDPHTVTARPSMIAAVRRAQLLVVNGLDFEVSFLRPLLESAANPRVLPGRPGYLDLGEFITPLEVPTGKVDRSLGDVHPFGNPHYYSDPNNIPVVATALAGRLSELDTDGAPLYEARLKTFREQWAKHIETWKQRMAPLRGKSVVLYHRSHIYFLKAFDLSLAATIEPVPGIPPSARDVAKLSANLKQQGESVVCILQEPWFEKKTAVRLGELLGIGVRESPEGEWNGKSGALARWFDELTSRLADCKPSTGNSSRGAP